MVQPARQQPEDRPARRRDALFFNRELSWIDFNARVLSEATNTANPLLERLKFLAIFSNNLDEFFMIYVPGMRERAERSEGGPRNVVSNLRAIRSRLQPLLAEQYRCFRELMELLAAHGVRLLPYAELCSSEQASLCDYFEREVLPVLTPLAVDASHPFPFISNLSLSLAVTLEDPRNEALHFARIKVPEPPALPRLISVPGNPGSFVLLEQVIAARLERLFPGQVVRAVYPFRVTRNADLELQESTDLHNILETIEEELPKRRFGELERLEIDSQMPPEISRTLIEALEASEDEVYVLDGPLNLGDLMPLAELDIPELRDETFTAPIPPALVGTADPFSAVRQGDVLLCHPYQSFDAITQLIQKAAEDPAVLAIKHTLYRTSDDSSIPAALVEAAANGKQVACLIEIKARFDEANNISWAKHLEKAGVHVVYGFPNLKTHCKVTLIVRRERDGLRSYVHVSTGNYNPRTATVYADVGLLTCAPEFGQDAAELFNYLTGYSRQEEWRRFLVAPASLRIRLLQLIEREKQTALQGGEGHVIAKMNSLVDPPLIEALYDASQAGVRIDLIVRGMCCLKPGVHGLSDNIRVVSIVGRFLEHARIFYFRSGGEEEVYIGSADWMPRNLDRRVEVIAPVLDPEPRKTLVRDILQLQLMDNTQSWELKSSGKYVRIRPAAGETRVNSQAMLLAKLAG